MKRILNGPVELTCSGVVWKLQILRIHKGKQDEFHLSSGPWRGPGTWGSWFHLYWDKTPGNISESHTWITAFHKMLKYICVISYLCLSLVWTEAGEGTGGDSPVWSDNPPAWCPSPPPPGTLWAPGWTHSGHSGKWYLGTTGYILIIDCWCKTFKVIDLLIYMLNDSYLAKWRRWTCRRTPSASSCSSLRPLCPRPAAGPGPAEPRTARTPAGCPSRRGGSWPAGGAGSHRRQSLQRDTESQCRSRLWILMSSTTTSRGQTNTLSVWYNDAWWLLVSRWQWCYRCCLL